MEWLWSAGRSDAEWGAPLHGNESLDPAQHDLPVVGVGDQHATIGPHLDGGTVEQLELDGASVQRTAGLVEADLLGRPVERVPQHGAGRSVDAIYHLAFLPLSHISWVTRAFPQ